MDKVTLERLDDDDWNILKRQKVIQLSSEMLIKLGSCCGSKCKHCPYDPLYDKGSTSIRKSLLR